ncbi:MAG: Gfo/Idh/MocA family oxidoreductase [Armatimonadota bacterium]
MPFSNIPQYGVGMIGYGFMGQMHSYAYKSIPHIYNPPPANIDIVGVSAKTEKSRQLAINQSGFKVAVEDYKELLSRSDIQIINICTPNYLHYEQASEAIKAGKHVYCEKPLAVTVQEAQNLAMLAKNSNKVCQITFHNRFIPAIMRAKQLIDDGRIGNIVSFRGYYLHSGYLDTEKPYSWRLDKSQSGGGALYDLGSHLIDLMRYLIGDFISISASLKTFVDSRPISIESSERKTVEVDDICILLLKHQNGSIGTIETSRIATGTEDGLRIEIHGTKGAIKFDLMNPNYLEFYDDTNPSNPIGGEKGFKKITCACKYPSPASLPSPKAPVGWIQFHIASLYDFINNIAKNKPASVSFEDGLAVQKIMNAAQVSSKDGSKWIEI